MGKKKATPTSTIKARRPGKVAQTIKNKHAKRAKHAKLHPEDKQLANAKMTERKASRVKGNFPDAKRKYMNEVSGQPLEAPSFAPAFTVK